MTRWWALGLLVVWTGCGGEDDTHASQSADLTSSTILSPPIEHFKYGSIGAD